MHPAADPTATEPAGPALPLHRRLTLAADAMCGQRPVTLGDLASLHGPAAASSLLVLLSVPCVLPVPGVGNVFGLALMLLALAMWRGQGHAPLPPRVARCELSGPWAQRVLRLLARCYALAERLARPRLAALAGPRASRGLLAPKVALMGALIFLPIPLGNVLPALALVLLGLGMAFRDGLAVILAGVAGLAALAWTAAVGAAAWAATWAWVAGPLLRALGLEAGAGA